MRALIDFDNTLAKRYNFPEIGEPINGAMELLEWLRDEGYDICIYSCRTSPDLFKHAIDRREQARKIEEWLERNKMPYTEVLLRDKPIADLYIGDEAVNFCGDTKKTIEQIRKMRGIECRMIL